MKKLPNIYKPKIVKRINNNTNMIEIKEEQTKINFESKNEINYKNIINKKVQIITTCKVYNTIVIKEYNKYIITINKDLILKNDIISIKIKSS